MFFYFNLQNLLITNLLCAKKARLDNYRIDNSCQGSFCSGRAYPSVTHCISNKYTQNESQIFKEYDNRIFSKINMVLQK